MRQQQDEYASLTTRSPDAYNVFNQIFISMMLGNDSPDGSLSRALKKYDDLLADNAERRKSMLQTQLNDKIDKLKTL